MFQLYGCCCLMNFQFVVNGVLHCCNVIAHYVCQRDPIDCWWAVIVLQIHCELVVHNVLITYQLNATPVSILCQFAFGYLVTCLSAFRFSDVNCLRTVIQCLLFYHFVVDSLSIVWTLMGNIVVIVCAFVITLLWIRCELLYGWLFGDSLSIRYQVCGKWFSIDCWLIAKLL